MQIYLPFMGLEEQPSEDMSHFPLQTLHIYQRLKEGLVTAWSLILMKHWFIILKLEVREHSLLDRDAINF